MGKKAKQNKIETQKQIVNEGTMEDSDHKLIQIIKNYLLDMLENTYNSLINEIFA